MPKDLVCGMEIDEKKAAKIMHKGKAYYFCSPTCQWAFEETPANFLENHRRIEGKSSTRKK